MPKKPEKKKKAPAKTGQISVKNVLQRAAKKVAKKGNIITKPKASSPQPSKKMGKIEKSTKKAPVVAASAAKTKSAPVKAPVQSKLAKAVKLAAPVKEVKAVKAAKSSKEAIAPAKAAKPAAPVMAVIAKGKKTPTVVEVIMTKAPAKAAAISKKAAAQAAALALAKKRCREPGCDNELLVFGFCRLHYIKNWRKIKRKEAILATGQLNNYVEELVSKYPDKYLDVIRQDLSSEKDWAKVVVDLELESGEDEAGGDEETEAVATEGVRRDRDFDDEGDAF